MSDPPSVTDECIRVRVRVTPRASHSALRKVVDGVLQAATRALPADGAANADIAQQLAAAFRVPKSRVTLLRGQRARIKDFRIAAPQHLPAWVADLRDDRNRGKNTGRA